MITTNPLVSVVMPTHNRADLLITRAIPSVLNQTYQNFEIIVVADRCTDDTRERVQGLGDPRIRFMELVDRPELPWDLYDRWRVAASAPRNKGFEVASGEWIVQLDDDDELVPNHIELLLTRALAGYDFVYGNILIVKPDGTNEVVGKYPPECGHIGTSSYICSSKYKGLKFNTDAVATEEPEDWNFCRRVIEAGATASYIDQVVYTHYETFYPWVSRDGDIDWTGERFVPWMEVSPIHYEHLHRYAFASQFVEGKRVIDLACGEGYGVDMLARNAQYVVGIDIDRMTVEHARRKYKRDNVEFVQGSILAVPLSLKFDVAVSFEAIEHIAEHDKFMSEVKRLLTPGGLFIVSTPEKENYTDAPNFTNPFHIKELYRDEFEGLLSYYFENVRLLGQKVYAVSNLCSLSGSSLHKEFLMRKGGSEFRIFEGKKVPLFIVAMASDSHYDVFDSSLVDVSGSLFNAYSAQIRVLQDEIDRLNRSIPIELARRYDGFVNKILRNGSIGRRGYNMVIDRVRRMLVNSRG